MDYNCYGFCIVDDHMTIPTYICKKITCESEHMQFLSLLNTNPGKKFFCQSEVLTRESQLPIDAFHAYPYIMQKTITHQVVGECYFIWPISSFKFSFAGMCRSFSDAVDAYCKSMNCCPVPDSAIVYEHLFGEHFKAHKRSDALLTSPNTYFPN